MYFLESFTLGTGIATYLLHTHLKPYLSVLPALLQPSSVVCTFSTIFFVGLILKVTFNVLIYPNFVSPLRHLPGPKPLSIINGNYAAIRKLPSGEPHLKWIDEVPNEGVIRYVAFANTERVFPTSPKTLHEVLHTKSHIFIKPQFMRRSIIKIFGERGMLFSEGDTHKVQRRHMSPAFSYKQLRGLVPTFWEKSVELVDAIEKELQSKQIPDAGRQDGVIIEMSHWLNRATLDIIGQAGFGYDFNCIQTDDETDLVRAYRNVFTPVPPGQQLFSIISLYFPPWLVAMIPSEKRRQGVEAIRLVQDLCMRMVREKKKQYETGGKVGEKDLLSLITINSPFDEYEMRDQLMAFLAAGHETTSSAVTWALHQLSMHPEVQSRLREEIRSHIPSPLSPTSVSSMAQLQESLDNLPYLRNVTNEVFRFFPPVAVTMRMASEDTTIGSYFIPQGTIIVIAPWAINRSKKIWGPTGGVFDPDRWERHKEGKENASNYDFMTFLHGPRSCIGKDFSRLEFKTLVATLVGRFEFVEELDANGKRKDIKGSGAISRPEGGLPLFVRRLDGW